MRIVYLGTKEVKGDNVAKTGLVWSRGQILEVEEPEKAAKLLEYPEIWADAEKDYTLAEPPKPREQNPQVNVIPQDATSPYWEPVVIPIPGDVFKQVQEKSLIPVFMTPEDADAFSAWKRERDDTAPRNTGPIPKVDKRTKGYRQGLTGR